MKINVVYAHPLADSYQASLHKRVVRTLKARGDEVIDFDLYEMKFNPVMQPEERGHFDPSKIPTDLRVYIEALQWAEACVFCFPTWWSGMPAMLKGYFDRVWRPGVAYHVPADGGVIRPALLVVYGNVYAKSWKEGAAAWPEDHVWRQREASVHDEIFRRGDIQRKAGDVRAQGGAEIREILTSRGCAVVLDKRQVEA
ncbi:NAD(P)H-dependent oxidoreductase [Mesorhizobium sp. 128a]